MNDLIDWTDRLIIREGSMTGWLKRGHVGSRRWLKRCSAAAREQWLKFWPRNDGQKVRQIPF